MARRLLTLMIAAAMALAPVGASAGMSASKAASPVHQDDMHDHQGAMTHDHGAMHMAAPAPAAKHCEDKSAPSCCCDDKGACAQTCPQWCSGQMAVLPPEPTTRQALALLFAALPTERPPNWSPGPQLPPPRS